MFEVAELGQKLSKQEFAEREPALREALLDAQERLGEAGFSVVIVIAGVEGAGKGETLHTLLQWMDARGIDAHALGFPSEEERERPSFYRFWRRLPAHGQIGIFFGSWYTGPIVRHVFGEIDDQRFERELAHIVEFERMLVDEGTLVLKFWLHISKAQQRKRFKKLASDPDTAWRVTPADWEFHETYDDFIGSASRALRRTSTGHAPWEVVEANDKRFRHVSVAERLLSVLNARLDAAAPEETTPAALPAPPKLDILNSLDLRLRLDPETYERKLSTLQGRIGRQSRRMVGADRSAVIVFEGSDAAGKGGCIRRVAQALDARFYRVIPIAAPTDEERAQPYLWRFWRQLPRYGHTVIYDRSWYGRVLVERIEGLCPPEAWQRAYAEINTFEEQLVEAGTLVFKFWLSISEAEQLRRFREREATGHKRYKLTPEDWRNRLKWPAYEAAGCEMIERTSTEIVPWTLVEAEDKRFARIKVLETVCDGFERALGPDRTPSRKKQGKKRRR